MIFINIITILADSSMKGNNEVRSLKGMTQVQSNRDAIRKGNYESTVVLQAHRLFSPYDLKLKKETTVTVVLRHTHRCNLSK